MSAAQRETIAYLVILAFCIVMLTWAIPTYTPPYPGYGASPALVPIVSVAVMLAMSVLALVGSFLAYRRDRQLPADERASSEDEETTGFTQTGQINLLHLASFLIPCALLVVGIDYIGFIPAALLFMLVIQLVIGTRKLSQLIIVSVAAVAVMYVIMRYGFGVPIPGPQLF